MRQFTDSTGFESARDATLFTVGVLEASGAHEKATKALAGVLAKWDSIDASKRKTTDAVTRANARVSWCDAALDAAVKKFSNELLRDCGGDANHAMFRSYFDGPPSEIVRLGLESEIAQCEALVVTSARVKLSKSADAALVKIKSAMVDGNKALAARKDAYAAQAGVWLDVAAWKQSANAARVSVYVALQSWALANGEDRTYADRFFPDASAKKVKKTPVEPST